MGAQVEASKDGGKRNTTAFDIGKRSTKGSTSFGDTDLSLTN